MGDCQIQTVQIQAAAEHRVSCKLGIQHWRRPCTVSCCAASSPATDVTAGSDTCKSDLEDTNASSYVVTTIDIFGMRPFERLDHLHFHDDDVIYHKIGVFPI